MDFEPINVHHNPGGQTRLRAHGLDAVPAVCVGDRCVPGADLEAVAGLVGVPYRARTMLPPSVLIERFEFMIEAAARYLRQVPEERLERKSPDRDRTLRNLGFHIFHIGTAFLDAYEHSRLDGHWFRESAPPEMRSGEDLAAYGDTVRAALAAWWERAGRDDPLDRVVETYWGAHTMHETMERETWHAAQHTRQVLMFLDQLGIEPDGPLTAADLEGLPLPEGVWD